MPLSEMWLLAEGKWSGTNDLHLSWLPEGERVKSGPIALSMSLGPERAFASIDYTWQYEDGYPMGQMMVCTDSSGKLTSGWVDSWHMNYAVMALSGTAPTGSLFDLSGEYEVPDHPNWGWRITLGFVDSALELKMFNISPDGEEEWAVKAILNRD
jgi:hypothetical protein